jgi:hypothetical protein
MLTTIIIVVFSVEFAARFPSFIQRPLFMFRHLLVVMVQVAVGVVVTVSHLQRHWKLRTNPGRQSVTSSGVVVLS